MELRFDWEHYAADCGKELAAIDNLDDLNRRLGEVAQEVYLRLADFLHEQFWTIVKWQYNNDLPGDDPASAELKKTAESFFEKPFISIN